MKVRRGLTVIELLVVLGLILALSALVLPGLSSRGDIARPWMARWAGSGRRWWQRGPRRRETGHVLAIVWSPQEHAGVLTVQDAGAAADAGDRDEKAEKQGDAAARVLGEPLTGVILRDSREGTAIGEGATGQRLVLALCLPDGSVQTPARVVASAGAERAELVVNHWTGAVTTQSAPDAKAGASEAEESPRAPAGTGGGS